MSDYQTQSDATSVSNYLEIDALHFHILNVVMQSEVFEQIYQVERGNFPYSII